MRRGAAASDGVIHTAFIHDFSKLKENCEIDRRAIDAIGTVLAGSDCPLVISSGVAILPPARPDLLTRQGASRHPSNSVRPQRHCRPECDYRDQRRNQPLVSIGGRQYDIHHAARSRDPLQWKMVKAAQEQDKAITADVTGWTPGDPRKYETWRSS